MYIIHELNHCNMIHGYATNDHVLLDKVKYLSTYELLPL